MYRKIKNTKYKYTVPPHSKKKKKLNVRHVWNIIEKKHGMLNTKQ